MAPPTSTVVILGTAAWDAPIATNQHYVACELARDSHVIFLEGTGTRSVRFTVADMRRIAARMSRRRTTGSRRAVPTNVSIARIWQVPIRSRATSSLNRLLLKLKADQLIGTKQDITLWVFTPYSAGLTDRTTSRTIYHLVDLIHNNPGVNRSTFLRAERSLSRVADLAIATSPAIAQHLTSQGFKKVLTRPNVADVSKFDGWQGRDIEKKQQVIFAGALTAAKLDFELMARLARSLKAVGAELVCIGPRDTAHTSREMIEKLETCGARTCPAMRLEELAEEYYTSRVAIIPYSINELTIGITPLKVFEYLAAGLPIVSTPLPAIRPLDDSIYVEETHSSFIATVIRLLHATDDHLAIRRLGEARKNDWSARGEEYRNIVGGFPEPKSLA